VRLLFVAPPALQIGDDILAMLSQAGIRHELRDDFEQCIPLTDAIYMTRIQDEWDSNKGESKQIDIGRYNLTPKHMELLNPSAIIMHPFPRRQEIAVDIDKDPRAMYWRQMRNGMWIRCALIATLFAREASIHDYYERKR
jgi:aspartate carbamoyltransferase catalytic subunit